MGKVVAVAGNCFHLEVILHYEEGGSACTIGCPYDLLCL